MNSNQVEVIFNKQFLEPFNTRLVGGVPEPLYKVGIPNELRYRDNHASSALHESAHWCIAGAKRRRLDDFGYWYSPARDAVLQHRFEQVEAKPQALEWIFSVAADVPFRVSLDNFEINSIDDLRSSVHRAVHDWLACGLNPRARQLADALSTGTGRTDYTSPCHYEALPV